MDRPNVNASYGKSSDVDSHASFLDEQAYTFMLNGNIEGTNGEGVLMLQNEPSNLLCVRFTEGYRVLTHLIDPTGDRTFFFLTNPETGCSKLVFVPNTVLVTSVADTEKDCGCNTIEILSTPLEEQEQTPLCNVEEVISDCGCDNLAPDSKCLNWHIDYPISAKLKDDKSGKIIYFTDDRNPMRRLELNNLEQYYTVGEGTCGEEVDDVCIDCAQLKVQKDYVVPCIDFQGLVNGGEQAHGTNVYYLAYCDDLGNEVTRYMAITGEVMVKDPNKDIYQQPELDDITNYSVSLDITDLDINFRYYKLAVLHRSGLDSTLSGFVVGVYPTTKTKVIHSTNKDKQRITLQELVAEYPIYTKAKNLEVANNKLWATDLEAQTEINLQPVVNLIGEFALWQTEIAEEDIYSDPIFIESKRGYMRDEVYPFSLRFGTTSGYVTALFPLISRMATDDDLYFDQPVPLDVEDIIDRGDASPLSGYEKDVYSVLKHSNSQCSPEERVWKWQYYNTATNEGLVDCVDVDVETETIQNQKKCEVITTATTPVGTVVLDDFEEGEQYTTFIDYLEDNQSYFASDPAYSHLVLDNYDNGSETTVDDCCDGTELFGGNCENVSQVGNPEHEFRNFTTPEPSPEITYQPVGDYRINSEPDFCNIFKPEVNSEGDFTFEADCGLHDHITDNCEVIIIGDAIDCEDTGYSVAYSRLDPTAGDLVCNNASEIPINSNFKISSHLNTWYDETDGSFANLWDTSISNLSVKGIDGTSYTGNISGIDGNSPIGKNVLWFKVTVNGLGRPEDGGIPRQIVFNLSEATGCSDRDWLDYKDRIRLSFFEDCSGTLIQSNGVDDVLTGFTGDGVSGSKSTLPSVIVKKYDKGAVFILNLQKYIDDGINISEIYVAVDQPGSDQSDGLPSEPIDCDQTGNWYFAGTCECFALNAYLPTIERVEVTINEPLRLSKVCTFEADCEVRVVEDLKCDPFPWEIGRFAYVESTEIYPDNAELYDSSNLEIEPGDIPDTELYPGTTIREKFEEVFVFDQTGGQYVLNDNADFRCKPIRHFRFPDNETTGITDGNTNLGTLPAFKRNKVFPIGLKLNNEMISAMLDLAVKNGLITQQFRSEISFYEVFRGDVRLNKTVIGKGLLYDMYEYFEGGTVQKNTLFSNFPYNKLGTNDLIYTDGSGDDYLDHPYSSQGNVKFTFHSPDFHFERPGLPFEMKTEGYWLGNSRGKFARVEGHPYMVLLGRRGYRVARALGIMEASLQLASDLTDQLVQTAQTSWFIAGLATGTNWAQTVAWISYGLYAGERITEFITLGLNRAEYEWLKIFDELGTPYNFASYYSSEGYYNGYDPDITEGNKIKGIKNSEYIEPGRYSFSEGLEEVNINHVQRETAVYLSLGSSNPTDFDRFGFDHPTGLRSFDDSRFKQSEIGCSFGEDYNNSTPEITRDLYAPYVSLKNYLPGQYGTIDSIDWISTNYCSNLLVDDPCDTETIFGGDIFISRFALKRKFPFFINPMLIGDDALGDFTPFDYTAQRNVGFPRFYVNYKTESTKNFGRFEMPYIKSNQEMDCGDESGMYITPPSKFYLYYYGIPSFLTESRINVNYRYGRNEKERDFYPHKTDYMDWTQEKEVSIREDNYYYYNNVYSTENDIYGYRILPFNFEQALWDTKFDHWDRAIFSVEDNTEQDLIDNWGTFKGNNFWDFGNEYGRFFGVKSIESEKVLARFENGIKLLNPVNTLQGTVEDVEIGSGNIFATRPIEFYKSDLGYAGTQHRAMISTPFGHFWPDAKRGRIFQIMPNGEGLDEVSRYRWKNWFRDNLPFKIARSFPNIPWDAMDNPLKDIGITMGWDDRFSRLFITKKDYELKDDNECCIEYKEGVGFVQNLTQCDGTPQVTTCPEGFVYNEETQLCEKVAQIPVSTTTECEFDLILVVDVSGSIDASEMTDVKTFLDSIIHDFLAPYIEDGNVSVGIVTFNSTGALHQSMLTGAGASSTIETAIANLPASGGGGTNLNAGLCAGHQELLLNGRVGFDKKLLLVTDGYATTTSPCDPLFNNLGSSSALSAFQQMETDLNGLGYECIVVGIGAESASASQPATWVEDRWNLVHNSPSNSGNAFSAETFTEILDEQFIADVFLSACESISECPEGWAVDGEFCTLTETVEPTIEDAVEPIDITTSECFEDCSWTVAYRPDYKTWVGWYSFTPNYYVPYDNYFQTGINSEDSKDGLWSHLLTNRSYQVFYGEKHPWIIELPTKNEFVNKWVENISYWLDVRRYKNERDFAQNRNMNFDHLVMYNHDENTGKLNLVRQEPDNRYQLLKHPKYNVDSWDVLAVQEHRKWSVNNLYDKVKDKYNSVPIWIHDCNDVDKELNPIALDYRPTHKNKMRGDWFLTRFYQVNDTQHKYVFKALLSHNKIYRR